MNRQNSLVVAIFLVLVSAIFGTLVVHVTSHPSEIADETETATSSFDAIEEPAYPLFVGWRDGYNELCFVFYDEQVRVDQLDCAPRKWFLNIDAPYEHYAIFRPAQEGILVRIETTGGDGFLLSDAFQSAPVVEREEGYEEDFQPGWEDEQLDGEYD